MEPNAVTRAPKIKSISDFNALDGGQKAAVILLARGEDHTRRWEMLDDEEIKEVSLAMSNLGAVAPQAVEALIVGMDDLILRLEFRNVRVNVIVGQPGPERAVVSDRKQCLDKIWIKPTPAPLDGHLHRRIETVVGQEHFNGLRKA